MVRLGLFAGLVIAGSGEFGGQVDQGGSATGLGRDAECSEPVGQP